MEKTCRNGHPRIPENLRPRKDGYFDCVLCSRESSKRYKDNIRETIRERGKGYYQENKEYIRKKGEKQRSTREWQDKRHIRLYGITLNEKQEVAVKQQHLCAICQRKTKLVVDHDHVTGGFRGLLCSLCNTGLGCFRDNPEKLQPAIVYLGGCNASVAQR